MKLGFKNASITKILPWAVCGTCTILVISFGCKGKKDTITAENKTIIESVYASASIKAADQYTVIAPVTGLLQNNLVKEGDSVIAGQIIAQIENNNPALNAANAKLGLDLARKNFGNLAELEAQISTLRRQVQLDSINYTRQQTLWSQNIGTKQQLEGRQLAYDASKNNLKAILTRYRQTKIQLQSGIEQAENGFAMASKQSNDFAINSKISGRVYALNYEPGELVVPQKPVAIIGRAGQFLLELTVDEVDISKLKIGLQVLVSMEAYRGEVFEARITKINPSLNPLTQTFMVEAEFITKPEKLYPGLSAETNIVIQKRENALVIPLAYLKGNNKVVTVDGEVEVKTGLRSIDMVEILSGIDKTTLLVKPK